MKPQDWDEWMANPVTLAFRDYLKNHRHSLEQQLLAEYQSGRVVPVETQREFLLVSETLATVLGLSFEVVNAQGDSET